MRIYKILVFIFLLIFTAKNADGQTFEAGIAAGFNMSQIDGDDLFGYHRIGGFAGPIVNINTSKRWQVATGIIYSQLGSAASRYDGISSYDKIRVNFVEVPVTLRFKDWKGEDDRGEYYRLGFEAGFSYGRLINHKAIAQTGEDISEVVEFQPNALNIAFGATYYINSKWGAHLHWAKQLNDLDSRKAEILVSKNINISIYYML